MINAAEIESYASQISEPDFEIAAIEPLIGHLSDAEIEAVIDRAAAIARERGRADMAAAAALETLARIAHAAGCPRGDPVIPWLQARNLVEEFNGGFRFKVANPRPVT